MKAIITVGVSASGKTTWANSLKSGGYVIGSRDEVRRHILETRLNRKLASGELWAKWKWKDEGEVSKIVNASIELCAANGQDIVIADTNLNPGHRVNLMLNLRSLGYEIEVKDFPVTFEEACRRDAGRADGVGMNVIWKQFQQWNEYIGTKKYVRDEKLPKAVMVDVDGTLATMGDRGPFDWNKVGVDNVRPEIADMVRGFASMGYEVIVMSGRDSACRTETLLWLHDLAIPFKHIFMRKANDMRKDSIVKEELFWEHVAHKYNVALVIDDRPQVCRQWRLMGLNVAQVADPLVEF